MNLTLFLEELQKLNINLTTKQQQQIDIYINELLKYNAHTNITAITDYNTILLKHFYDSLTLVKVYDFTQNIKLLDIGSGAGFPSVVLKIVFPNISLTVLDSNRKKTKFLEILVEKLQLSDIEIINERAEDFIKNRREFYDVVTTRAVASLRIISELAIPFLKVKGLLLAMKSNYTEELDEAKTTIDILNSELIKIETLELPIEKSKRNILVITKKLPTNLKYPRRYSQIVKKPLQK